MIKKIIVEGEYLRSAEDAHPYLKEKFKFPDYYGQNLDALFDCLTDICEETEIIFWNLNAEEKYTEKLLKVFLDAQEENSNLTVEIKD